MNGYEGTNWERWFGDPNKAADSVSRLVDMYDAIFRGLHDETVREEGYSSPFTDNFQLGGSCEFGLIHQDTLARWLESEEDE